MLAPLPISRPLHGVLVRNVFQFSSSASNSWKGVIADIVSGVVGSGLYHAQVLSQINIGAL